MIPTELDSDLIVWYLVKHELEASSSMIPTELDSDLIVWYLAVMPSQLPHFVVLVEQIEHKIFYVSDEANWRHLQLICVLLLIEHF